MSFLMRLLMKLGIVSETKILLNEALAKSEQDKLRIEELLVQTQALLNTAVNGILTIDKLGIVREINSAGCQLLQVEYADICGKSILKYVQKSDHSLDSLEGELLVPCVHRVCQLINGKGERHPIEVSISNMQGQANAVYTMLIRDMTEQYKIEKEIEDKNAIHKAIIDSSLDAIISIDSAGFIYEFGPAAEKLLGFSAAEVYGKRLEETIIPHSMRAAHTHKMENPSQEYDQSILSKRIEVEALHKDGHRIPIEMVVAPIEVNGDRMFTSFIRDISERLAHEKEMTRALEQAQAGSEEKSRFLATMSHEIRSPLNAVLGSLDLLQETQLSAEQYLYAKTSKDAGQALLSLINDVLDFSKIEAGLLELDPQQFSIVDMFDQAMQITYPKAKEKGLDLIYVLDKSTPAQALGDVVRLRQVIINLVDNAIKFTEHGTVQILVSAKKTEDSGVRLQVEINDPGIGVPLEARRKLFEEFAQVDASHSTKYGGTGLGLAICRRIVELMGGEISIDMNRQQGSQFLFDVVLAKPEAEKIIITKQSERIRIAVVHSDATYRLSVQSQLAMYDIDCKVYQGIDELLSQGRSDLNDVILLDEQHVNNKPLTFIEKIKKEQLKKSGKLVLLTAELNTTSKLDGNIDLFMLKPLSRVKLLSLLGFRCNEERVSQVSSKTVDCTKYHGIRILLAEDSTANQLVATSMLMQSGFIVDVANNGQEAVDAVASAHYDLVLMDMRMPGMDGLSATRLIRDNTDNESLPIIALTANAQTEDVENCLNVGMNAYLSKPINKAKLLEAIDAVLSDTIIAGA